MTDWTAQVIVQGPDDGSLVIETSEPGETALVSPPDGDAVSVTGEGADGSTLILDPGDDISIEVSEGQPDEIVEIIEGQDPVPLIVETGLLREAPVPVVGLTLSYDGEDNLTGVTRTDGIGVVLAYTPEGALSTVTKSKDMSELWTKTLGYDAEGKLVTVTPSFP